MMAWEEGNVEVETQPFAAHDNIKSYRHILINTSWADQKAMLKWAWGLDTQHGRWTVLYGMDIWIGRVPLIRTIIAANALLWALIWLAR